MSDDRGPAVPEPAKPVGKYTGGGHSYRLCRAARRIFLCSRNRYGRENSSVRDFARAKRNEKRAADQSRRSTPRVLPFLEFSGPTRECCSLRSFYARRWSLPPSLPSGSDRNEIVYAFSTRNSRHFSTNVEKPNNFRAFGRLKYECLARADAEGQKNRTIYTARTSCPLPGIL